MPREASPQLRVVRALAALACACTGCASAPARPADSFSAGALRPTVRALAASDLLPASGLDHVAHVTEGDDAGALAVDRLVRENSGLVLVRERDGRTDERLHLTESEDGLFRLVEVETLGESMRSVFAEPLPFAPRTLSPDAPCAGESPMEVRTVPGNTLRARGTARRSLAIVGECDVEHLGKRLTAVVAEFRFDARLDAARAEVRSELFVVPGVGIVAERRREKRVILGILGSTSSETAVLFETTPTGPAPAPASR
ncbi:MAG: hypothetical protein RL354_1206 [Planctomycetota bacterium]|jgi:hypothetical protein